jgi:hypothetical protein
MHNQGHIDHCIYFLMKRTRTNINEINKIKKKQHTSYASKQILNKGYRIKPLNKLYITS